MKVLDCGEAITAGLIPLPGLGQLPNAPAEGVEGTHLCVRHVGQGQLRSHRRKAAQQSGGQEASPAVLSFVQQWLWPWLLPPDASQGTEARKT